MNRTKNLDMTTLSSCLDSLKKEGYSEEFTAKDNQLLSATGQKKYNPDEVKFNNFYRFEGESDPDDSSILYAVETTDGVKGTLIDAYGSYSDAETNKFVRHVTGIEKRVDKKEIQKED